MYPNAKWNAAILAKGTTEPSFRRPRARSMHDTMEPSGSTPACMGIPAALRTLTGPALNSLPSGTFFGSDPATSSRTSSSYMDLTSSGVRTGISLPPHSMRYFWTSPRNRPRLSSLSSLSRISLISLRVELTPSISLVITISSIRHDSM